MLLVCTTAAETQLAALGDLLVLLGTTASSSGQDLALTQASAWAERYITNSPSGVMRRQVYRETVAGYGGQRLRLTRVPVLKVTRLFDATDTCAATEYCSTDFRLEDADAGFVEMVGNSGFSWDAVQDWNLAQYPRPAAVTRPWLVDYEAGWQYACTSSTSNDWLSTTTGRTLPEDVERAVLIKAADFYQGGSISGLKSMTVGPLTLQNFGSETLDPVKELLSPYVRI